jgi:hypothetical protein
MKNLIIEMAGKAIEQTYRGFHMALVGAVTAALNSTSPTAPRTRGALLGDIQRLEASVMTAITSTFDGAVINAIDFGLDAAESDDEELRAKILEAIQEPRSMVLATISLAMHKDSTVAVKRLRDFAINVDMLMQGRRRDLDSAVSSARQAEQAKGMAFSVTDTLGRQWKPALFAAATANMALQIAYGDAFAVALAAQGVNTVELRYPDPTHEGHGSRMSLAGSEHPTYISQRDAVFHPNSTALLAKPE